MRISGSIPPRSCSRFGAVRSLARLVLLLLLFIACDQAPLRGQQPKASVPPFARRRQGPNSFARRSSPIFIHCLIESISLTPRHLFLIGDSIPTNYYCTSLHFMRGQEGAKLCKNKVGSSSSSRASCSWCYAARACCASHKAIAAVCPELSPIRPALES